MDATQPATEITDAVTQAAKPVLHWSVFPDETQKTAMDDAWKARKESFLKRTEALRAQYPDKDLAHEADNFVQGLMQQFVICSRAEDKWNEEACASTKRWPKWRKSEELVQAENAVSDFVYNEAERIDLSDNDTLPYFSKLIRAAVDSYKAGTGRTGNVPIESLLMPSR